MDDAGEWGVRKRATTPLPDRRTLELAVTPIESWFRYHAAESFVCECAPAGAPDETCNVGMALYRLSASARAGKLDAHSEKAA